MNTIRRTWWNLAASFAVAGWVLAVYLGAVVVGYRTMYLGHFFASGIVVYGFALYWGDRAERADVTRTTSGALWTGVRLALACYAAGALAIAVVNLGLGLYDTCCSERFGGEFGLRSRTFGGMLHDAFVEPLAWILALGALPAATLGVAYGWVLHRRNRISREERA